MNSTRSGSSTSTKKSRSRDQNPRVFCTDSIFDDHNNQTIDVDEKQKPQTSSNSYFKPSNRRKAKWAPRNRAAHVKKPDFGPKPEVGGSGFGEIESGLGMDETESEVRERNSGGEIEAVRVSVEESGNDDDDDVFSRLEKLRIGVEDFELSEDQIAINDQAQEDELLAMESIYGDNVYILEKRRGLRSFQIHIHIGLPSEFSVSAKLQTTSHSDPGVDSSNNFSYSFKVQYLSPIVLTCLLPKSYPSHLLPSFTISVQWLHESNISKLCSMLDSLWNEQPGQEILYQWVEWLHSSSLSYLGFGEELLLGPYDVEKTDFDRRAFSGCASPDIDIPLMRNYNEERQHENFLSNCHECCICFSEYAGSEFLRLPCHHFFCEKCMKTYADVHVKEGTVNKLQCPNTKCGGMIPPGLLKRLLGDEEFDRWESLMLQKTLDGMSDITYCPRCQTACLEDEEDHAQCCKCYFSFCTLCRERRHVGIQCMTPEMKLKLLEERQNSNLKSSQLIKEREMINELRSVTQILKDAKQCPACKMAISKIEGCNKMVCSNCRQYFCYRCNKAIDGYDHFRDGNCELFPQDVINHWEEQLNDRQRIGQIQAQAGVFAGNARPCPGCRQMNAKLGNNNHIFCWACQNHFCYLCRKIVRRSSEHYGPKGCKQHTAD